MFCARPEPKRLVSIVSSKRVQQDINRGSGTGVGHLSRIVAAAITALLIAACQSPTTTSFDSPVFSDETRALEKQLEAEAAALGTAQAAMSMPAAWDPTGAASLATIPAGLAAREAWRRNADARMEAQLDKDERAFLRRYGMNPDGTPSGRRPGS